jgi:hypothetical protein
MPTLQFVDAITDVIAKTMTVKDPASLERRAIKEGLRLAQANRRPILAFADTGDIWTCRND